MSRSGYYKWLNKDVSSSEQENQQISEEVLIIHQQVKHIYGYRRMTIQINKNLGTTYNPKRIRRIMKQLGISSVIRRSRPAWKRSKAFHVAENKLSRQFDSATAPNEIWCTDVTEFKCSDERKVYLSAVIDLFDKSIVSYVAGFKNDNALVMETIKQAFKYNPDCHPMIHSDRGYQYTSIEYHHLKSIYGFNVSMSRISKCLDNQPIESFFGTLKAERFYLNSYKNREDLLTDLDDYIYFYNHQRIMTKYDGLSPSEYRTKSVA